MGVNGCGFVEFAVTSSSGLATRSLDKVITVLTRNLERYYIHLLGDKQKGMAIKGASGVHKTHSLAARQLTLKFKSDSFTQT